MCFQNEYQSKLSTAFGDKYRMNTNTAVPYQSCGKLSCSIQKVMNRLVCISLFSGLASLTDENLEALSPSAAAASRLLKSGMTLTQVI